MPEDVAVNVSRSQQDLPLHRSNDDVFEVPSTCSLAWDSQYDVLHASTPTQPCNPTTSTQFDISIAPLHNLTVQEEHADSDEYHSPEDTDMASNHSQAQAAPGPATTLQDHMVTLQKIVMTYQDDYCDLDPDSVDTPSLQAYLRRATEAKNAAQDCIFKLQRTSTPEWEEMKEQAAVAKRGLIAFIRSSQKTLKEREDRQLQIDREEREAQRQDAAQTAAMDISLQPAERQRSKGATLKANRVTNNTAMLTAEIKQLVEELNVIADYRPETNAQFTAHSDKLDGLVLKVKSVKSDSHNLCSDAMDVNMEDAVIELDKVTVTLRRAEREALTSLQELKETFGPVKSAGNADVPVPKFNGKPGEGLDFYTFNKQWTQYCDARPNSNSEYLRILIYKCLDPPARTAAMGATNVKEVLDRLKVQYGNVRMLFRTKVSAIVKTGACKGTNLQRREWTIDIRQKLVDLQELSEQHNLTNTLYYSDVREIVEENLTASMRKDYIDLCLADGRLEDPEITHEEGTFALLLEYLNDAITRLNFMVNHESNHGRNLQEGEGKREIQKSSNPPPRANKPNATHKEGKTKAFTVQKVDGNQAKMDDGKSGEKNTKPKRKRVPKLHIAAAYEDPKPIKCSLCKGGEHTHIYYCPEFAKTTLTKARRAMCYKTFTCFRCLRMDAALDMNDRKAWYRKHEVHCQTEWACNVGNCEGKDKYDQFHFIMCLWHTEENAKKEDEFKKACDKNKLPTAARFFYCFPDMYNVMPIQPVHHKIGGFEVEPDIAHPSIFLLQNITVNDRKILIFYDSGCMTAAINTTAAATMESVNVRPGPSTMCVAGGDVIQIPGGDEQVIIPMTDKKGYATVTAVCMDQVTSPFPTWHIAKAWEEIVIEFQAEFPELNPEKDIPARPSEVGGKEVDLIIGIKYYKYYPRPLYALPSGLTVYHTRLTASNDENCILGGPHQAWSHCVSSSNTLGVRNFLSAEVRAFYYMASTLNFSNHGLQHLPEDDPVDDIEGLVQHIPEVDDEYSGLKSKEDCIYKHCTWHEEGKEYIIPNSWDLTNSIYTAATEANDYEKLHDIGSEVTYRCSRCRNCHQCRDGEKLEYVSLKEEAEQALIEDSVYYIPEKGIIEAKLPFILPPEKHLNPNRHIAMKVLCSQVTQANKDEQARLDIIASHEKLRSHGHVCDATELDEEEYENLKVNPPGTYYIPWRAVHKHGSVSTPTRIVFDASAKTPQGESLNNILAKGTNTLANLNSKLLRFRLSASGFSADIRMAYNAIKLHPSQYKHQLYLWQEELDPDNPVKTMVVKTVIYGVRPSGNQLTAGFSQLADFVEQNLPEHLPGAKALRDDSYVDDILHPSPSHEEAVKTARSLEMVLSLAGMKVKGFTFPGSIPPEDVSTDGRTVGLIGHVWEPEPDIISPDIKPLFFGRIKRGKLPTLTEGNFTDALKENFTRRTVLSKVMAVYDPIGLLTAVTSRFKLDLHGLCKQENLDWDDKIPEKYLLTWIKNIDDIQLLRQIKFRRAIIPPDAASDKVSLLVSCDASQNLAVATVHARVKRNNGEYSCQLLTAKSRIVNHSTVPKGELRAAVMGASLSHVVKYNLEKNYEDTLYCTDSTITLYWIVQDQRALQTYVRNSVIEIRRFSDISQWYHISTDNNIADLGTREAEVTDIAEKSEWQDGKLWMRGNIASMPLKSVSSITLDNEEKRLAGLETKIKEILGCTIPVYSNKTVDRYKYSRYLVDPIRYDWLKLLRIIGYILKFVKRKLPSWKPDWFGPATESDTDPDPQPCYTNNLTEVDIIHAENYIFFKTTAEVKQFWSSKEIKENTMVKNSILYYVGRIVDNTLIDSPDDAFFDVQPLSFVKPVVCRHSPVAYAIMMHAHARLARHKGVNFTLRESRTVAYILQARTLAVDVDSNCRPCKKYKARLAECELGKINENRITIAPPFYSTQTDLFGPLEAQCEHNHRSKLKLWGAVFKCTATGAIAINAMQSYSTAAYLQAYTRFASRYGHCTHLAIDQGSQLMQAVKSMEISMVDLTDNLSSTYQVGIKHTSCAVQGHNQQGQVERSIQEIKRLLERVYQGLKLDILSHETCFQWIANELNNLPHSIGNRTDNLEHIDLITPNRILLGRNNRRALSGYAKIESNSRLVGQIDSVYKAWWSAWLNQCLADFIPRPNKWHNTSRPVKVKDIVIYLKETPEQHFGEPVWKIGKVVKVHTSKDDDIIRNVTIQYKNSSEKSFRYTRRSVRSIAVVYSEDELDIVQQVEHAAQEAAKQLLQEQEPNGERVPELIDKHPDQDRK